MKKSKCKETCPFRLENGFCYTEEEWERWKREKPFYVPLETELQI